MHLLSRESAVLLAAEPGSEGALDVESVDAAEVVGWLDAAGVGRAAVLSQAFQFGGSCSTGGCDTEGEAVRVRTENDWLASQVASAPDRLVGFCAVDPLSEYALTEVRRCGLELGLKGVKLHFMASGVDLRLPRHRAAVASVFSAVDRLGMTILVHLRGPADYGRVDAELFLKHILPAAPHVSVQIAHMAGWGGYDGPTDSALAVFAHAAAAGLLREKVYFDLAFVLPPGLEPGEGESTPAANGNTNALIRRIRKLGPERVLFGSDSPLISPAEYAAHLGEAFGADPILLHRIFSNVPPYLRPQGSSISRRLRGFTLTAP